jgi:hypothetical protein
MPRDPQVVSGGLPGQVNLVPTASAKAEVAVDLAPRRLEPAAIEGEDALRHRLVRFTDPDVEGEDVAVERGAGLLPAGWHGKVRTQGADGRGGRHDYGPSDGCGLP